MEKDHELITAIFQIFGKTSQHDLLIYSLRSCGVGVAIVSERRKANISFSGTHFDHSSHPSGRKIHEPPPTSFLNVVFVQNGPEITSRH
jgi:hypothetical protein